MIKWFILLLLSNAALAKEPLRVVILDTGLDIEDVRFNKLLCKDYQGLDFTNEGLEDVEDHGTHVTGIIKKYAKDSNYCLTIIKYYAKGSKTTRKALIQALTWIHWIKPAYVNFSSGGRDWYDEEFKLIKETPETKFIVAVGNDTTNLDKVCDYYPACYPLKNIYRVGSLNRDGTKARSSNFGSIVNFWQIGEHVLSTVPNDREDYMSGTSMATAVQTGKMIYEETHNSYAFNPKSKSCEE